LTMELADGLVQKLKSYGRNLVLWGTHGVFEAEEEYFHKVDEVGLDGLIWWPDPTMRRHEILNKLTERQFPIVTLDNTYPDLTCPCVQADHYGGMRQAVEHLIRMGHKRIAFITNDANRRLTHPAVQEREQAYLDAMKEAGLPVDPEWLGILDPDLCRRFNTDPRINDIVPYEPVHKLISLLPRPTAIILIHEGLASGAAKAIRNSRLRVPEDISITTFGDMTNAHFFDVPLTAVHYPARELGLLAAELMEKMINREQIEKMEWRLHSELIVRGSVARPCDE